jgi:hypothetical protein
VERTLGICLRVAAMSFLWRHVIPQSPAELRLCLPGFGSCLAGFLCPRRTLLRRHRHK